MENTKVVSVIKVIIARPIKWTVLFIIKNIQLYFIKKKTEHLKNEKNGNAINTKDIKKITNRCYEKFMPINLRT